MSIFFYCDRITLGGSVVHLKKNVLTQTTSSTSIQKGGKLSSAGIMSNSVEVGLAKSTGLIGIAAGLCGLGDCICGFIWLGYNGYGGHGLWSGFGVSY